MFQINNWIKSTSFFIVLLLSLMKYQDVNASTPIVPVTLRFENDTTQTLTQLQPPYIDNFRHWSFNPDNIFTPPAVDILPGESTTAKLQYPWNWDSSWYGMSQFSYHYKDRDISLPYGCFITELRLSGILLGRPYNVAMTSYRQDPAYPDDYLTCDITQGTLSSDFIIHLRSSRQAGDQKKKDSERFFFKGGVRFLNSTTYYGINKPITLWEDTIHNQRLVLFPDDPHPQFLEKPLPSSNPPKESMIVTLVNASSETLKAKEPPLLDKFSKLNERFYVEEPIEIKPGETGLLKLNGGTRSTTVIGRFNYQLPNHSDKEDGCYITLFRNTQSTKVPLVITSYHLDPSFSASEKNLYCSISSVSNKNQGVTVVMYDNFSQLPLWDTGLQLCRANQDKCVVQIDDQPHGWLPYLSSLSVKMKNSSTDQYQFPIDPQLFFEVRE